MTDPTNSPRLSEADLRRIAERCAEAGWTFGGEREDYRAAIEAVLREELRCS